MRRDGTEGRRPSSFLDWKRRGMSYGLIRSTMKGSPRKERHANVYGKKKDRAYGRIKEILERKTGAEKYIDAIGFF